MLKKISRAPYYLLAAVLAGAACALAPASQAFAVSAGTCQTVTVQARLAPLLPANQTMVGDLCLPNAWAAGDRRVDVLLHGGTYDRSYWDFPVSYPDYSYVERTLTVGRATFAYDQLGVGDSSRPPSALATQQAEAYILHQIVGWLRANDNDFDSVTLVGHSLGSAVAMEEAGTYHDVDAVVVTGFLHEVSLSIAQIVPGAQPAALDPQFAGLGYEADLGYLSASSSARSASFYQGATDSAVIAYDETHKAVLPVGLPATFGVSYLPALLNKSSHITTDVLTIAGALDEVSCGTLLDCTNPAAVFAHEAPYFGSAASFAAQTVANTGHNLALHPSAGASFDTINQWIETH